MHGGGIWSVGMYKRILLASDRSQEALIALREGALLAQTLGAEVFLLVVDVETPGGRIAASVHLAPQDEEVTALMARGLDRLSRLGVRASGSVVRGEPAAAIGDYARRFGSDLVVVGHRRQGLFERWWSGASGAYLVDTVDCTVLIARNVISDAEFESRLAAA